MMESRLCVFNHQKFGQIRTIELGGQMYFVATDIAKALKYSNFHKAINDHCLRLTKCDVETQTGLRKDGLPVTKIVAMNIIPKDDVYLLLAHSKLPNAKEFKCWIENEILHTVHKLCGHGTDEELFVSTYLPFADDAIKDLFKSILTVIRQQNEVIIEQERELIKKEDLIIGLVDNISLIKKQQAQKKASRKNTLRVIEGGLK